MESPVQSSFGSGSSATSTSSTSSPVHSSEPAPPVTSVSSALTQALDTTTFSFGASAATRRTIFRSRKVHVQASSSATDTSFSFPPAQDFSKTTSVSDSNIPRTPFSSLLPGFGVGYFPGSSFSTPVCSVGSVSAALKTTETTMSPSYSSSPSATFSSNPKPFASHEWSRSTEKGSRYPCYAPTPDFEMNGHSMISISASASYRYKSHEELRWEDYNQRDKGGLFPSARISPINSRPNTFFSPSTVSPSIFACRSIFDHPQWTTQGNMTGSAFASFPAAATTSSSGSAFGTLFQNSSSASSTTFPTAVSSPASGCTACGATSSPSASSFFNVATIPPSSAISLPGLFFSTSGSFPVIFGTTPTIQAYPMMFGTTIVAQGENLPVQGTTPAIQAYHVHGFILLPFAAMNLS